MKAIWDAAVCFPEPSSLGEGPWWDAERSRLLWVDIPDGLVHALTPRSGDRTSTKLNHAVGFVVGEGGGGFVAGTANGLLYLNGELEPQSAIGAPPGLDAGHRINDGTCDPAGRLLFGTVDLHGAATGTLWSFEACRGFTPLLDGVEMSNGIGFSPDWRLLYYVDSPKQRVERFDYDVKTGSLSDRETVFAVPEETGMPDGLAVDQEGFLWLALWGGGCVWRISPDGEHVGTVRVPAVRTTSCAFGGVDRGLLYITSARDGASNRDSAADDSAAGALFVADVGVVGLPLSLATVDREKQD